MPRLSSVVVRSFRKGVGQHKTPELTRVTSMLHNCPKLEELTIAYMPQPQQLGFALPRADELFTYGRWMHLRALTLTSVACTGLGADGVEALVTFLSAHPALEALRVAACSRAGSALANTGMGGNEEIVLQRGSLPRLRELRCDAGSAGLAQAILRCPVGADIVTNADLELYEAAESTSTPALPSRPLETLVGLRLNAALLAALQVHAHTNGSSAFKRIDLAGFTDPADLRRLAACVPGLEWLDVGRRIGGGGARGAAPVTNVVSYFLYLSTKKILRC